MTFNAIGIGLDTEDLTSYSVSIINSCRKIFLLGSQYHPYNKIELEEKISKDISIIYAQDFDEEIVHVVEDILPTKDNVALLMPGNPFCDGFFFTIASLCHNYEIDLKLVHNCSYLNAMGNTGIQLYKFGRTVIVDQIENNMDNFLRIINSNRRRHLNTLIIFDQSNSELPSQFLNAIYDSNLKDLEELNSCPSLVVLCSEEKGRHFDYCSVADLKTFKNIKALAICPELDCMEEEYLSNMKKYRKEKGNCDGKKGNFNIIGLGLGKPEDITMKGKRLIERSDKIFLEGYTSIMLGGKDDLESFFKKEIIVVDRETVEQKSDEILEYLAENMEVSFLVVGDPFGATTHTDIILRSLDKSNDVTIANNASIFNSIGLSGLKPSKFGGTVSIPFWNETYKPDSFYSKIVANKEMGLHTLCLLDIQVKEQSLENLMRGRKVYEKPRYMSVSVAAQQLLECKNKNEVNSDLIVDENSQTICLLRIGTATEDISSYLLGDLPSLDLGLPLHSMIIVGNLDEDEKLLNIKR